MILGALRERLADAESLRYVFEKVEAEVAKLLSTAPDDIRQKEAELDAISRKIAHFVEFVGQGRGSKALAEALMLAEKKAEALNEEPDALRRARQPELRTPPMVWIEERVATLQEVLERRTERSALLLRKLLGRIRLEPIKPDIGRPYFRAVSKLQPLALLEMDASSGDSEEGSNPLRWWRRRELDPDREAISERITAAPPSRAERGDGGPGRKGVEPLARSTSAARFSTQPRRHFTSRSPRTLLI